MRIHIGRISSTLAANSEDLGRLLDKYGQRLSEISLHKREFGDYHFGFVDMDLDSKQYAHMRSQLNNVTFKQSKLEIREARMPDYPVRVATVPVKPHLNLDQVKRLNSRGSRVINLFRGRHRNATSVREHPTFRVRINNELRKPRLRKTKLWGVEKRPLSKLTSQFVDGEWRDSDGQAIEVVANAQDEHARDLKISEMVGTAAYLSDSDFDEFKEHAIDLEPIEETDDIEVVPRNDEEVLGKASDDDMDVSDEPGTNSVQILKSAFSVETPFTLFGNAVEAPVAAQVSVAEPEPKLGLFFSHKSPYLRAQSQASRLAGVFNAEAWEQEFFEKRSEFKADLRKRRRDALRTARRMGKKRGEI